MILSSVITIKSNIGMKGNFEEASVLLMMAITPIEIKLSYQISTITLSKTNPIGNKINGKNSEI